jgi:hypothetical protein
MRRCRILEACETEDKHCIGTCHRFSNCVEEELQELHMLGMAYCIGCSHCQLQG